MSAFPLISFYAIIFFVIIQRIIELRIARKNTAILIKNGAVEFGADHYWMLILLHSCFFLSLFVEAYFFGIHFPKQWGYWLGIFVLAQICRVWIIRKMNGRWTTRIIVMPGKELVQDGPFKFLRHPNYMVVAIELFSLPMIFGLRGTAIVFSLLNAGVLLGVRIPEENRALKRTIKSSNI